MSAQIPPNVDGAGGAHPHTGGLETDPDDGWVDALDLAFLSAVRVTTALLPALREAGAGGAVVTISSAAAHLPAPPVRFRLRRSSTP